MGRPKYSVNQFVSRNEHHMTVKELIEELTKMPENAKVYTVDFGADDGPYGYDDPHPVFDGDCVLL